MPQKFSEALVDNLKHLTRTKRRFFLKLIYTRYIFFCINSAREESTSLTPRRPVDWIKERTSELLVCHTPLMGDAGR